MIIKGIPPEWHAYICNWPWKRMLNWYSNLGQIEGKQLKKQIYDVQS